MRGDKETDKRQSNSQVVEQDFEQLRAREWVREVFTPRDAIVHGKGRSYIEPGGWDHEHCLLCDVAISEKSETHWHGYRDEDDHWLREVCYARHIGPVRGAPPARPSRRSRVGRVHAWRRRERRGRRSTGS